MCINACTDRYNNNNYYYFNNSICIHDVGTLRKNIHPKEAAGWLFDMKKSSGTYMRSSQQFNPLSRYTLSTRGKYIIHHTNIAFRIFNRNLLACIICILYIHYRSYIHPGPWLGPQSPRSRGSTSRGFSRHVTCSGQNYEGGPESFSVVEGTTMI